MYFLLWILYATRNIWKMFMWFCDPANFQKNFVFTPKIWNNFLIYCKIIKHCFCITFKHFRIEKSIYDQIMKKINQNKDIYKIDKKVVFRNLFFWSTRGSFFWFFSHQYWSLGHNTAHIKAMTLANHFWLLKKMIILPPKYKIHQINSNFEKIDYADSFQF